MSGSESTYEPWAEYRRVIEKYQRDHIEVMSTTKKRATYEVSSVKDSRVVFNRIARPSEEVVTSRMVESIWSSLNGSGGQILADSLFPASYNRILRWAILQAPWLIYRRSDKMVLDARNEEHVLAAIEDACDHFGDWLGPEPNRHIQRQILKSVINGIGCGEITENRIDPKQLTGDLSDYIGEGISDLDRESAANAFYQLSSVHIWLCSIKGPKKRVEDTLGLPYEQLDDRIPFAMLKEPVWKLMHKPEYREAVLSYLSGERKPRVKKMPNTIQLNTDLLRKAVDQVIRPLLIDQGYLEKKKHEGWQHQTVIPKVAPLLTQEAVAENPRENLTDACRSNRNLLNANEMMFAITFLEVPTQEELVDHALDFLYGDDDEATRFNRFLDWAKAEKVEGKNRHFNGTAASFLLAMSNPRRYAFCKPTAYRMAAEALLGESVRPSEGYGERQAHCSEFYKAALAFMANECGLPFTDLMHVHIAFYVMSLAEKNGLPTWEQLASGDVEVANETRQMIVPKSLNQILYGPPGTGKTYAAVRRAVTLCDGVLPDTDRAVASRFNELVRDNRVAMVTFHQSFGYEDFVEGIRPQLDGGGSEDSEDVSTGVLNYVCKEGVFRSICHSAETPVKIVKSLDIDLDNTYVWKMSLANSNNPSDLSIYRECITDGKIMMGWGGPTDYTGCDDLDAVRERLASDRPDAQKQNTSAKFMNLFKNTMKVGELVVVSKGLHQFRAIGRVTGDYAYDENRESFCHSRPVEWLFVKDDGLPIDRFLIDKQLSMQTIYWFQDKDLDRVAIKALLTQSTNEEPGRPKPHVLIIDEINRANVSKVFGELITLLEPDKRIGADNELRVQLPYSNDLFGVPSNLYVIGTMNTADRSIALIDTALRRRFNFEEVMPDIGVVEEVVGDDGYVDGVSVTDLLRVMNQRIELLYDRDHQLGHSFFLKVKTLQDLQGVFLKAVIPMLQEYFYGDWPRVAAVLGCPYDSESGEALHKTAHPLIVSEKLDASIVHSDGGYTVSDVRYEINPAFEQAEEEDLIPFFEGVLNGVKAASQ